MKYQKYVILQPGFGTIYNVNELRHPSLQADHKIFLVHITPYKELINITNDNKSRYIQNSDQQYTNAGVIGSDVPWLECPACNTLTWVITVTE